MRAARDSLQRFQSHDSVRVRLCVYVQLQFGRKFTISWYTATGHVGGPTSDAKVVPGDAIPPSAVKRGYTVEALAADTKYALKVRAQNRSGWGPFSARSADMATAEDDAVTEATRRQQEAEQGTAGAAGGTQQQQLTGTDGSAQASGGGQAGTSPGKSPGRDGESGSSGEAPNAVLKAMGRVVDAEIGVGVAAMNFASRIRNSLVGGAVTAATAAAAVAASSTNSAEAVPPIEEGHDGAGDDASPGGGEGLVTAAGGGSEGRARAGSAVSVSHAHGQGWSFPDEEREELWRVGDHAPLYYVQGGALSNACMCVCAGCCVDRVLCPTACSQRSTVCVWSGDRPRDSRLFCCQARHALEWGRCCRSCTW